MASSSAAPEAASAAPPVAPAEAEPSGLPGSQSDSIGTTDQALEGAARETVAADPNLHTTDSSTSLEGRAPAATVDFIDTSDAIASQGDSLEATGAQEEANVRTGSEDGGGESKSSEARIVWSNSSSEYLLGAKIGQGAFAVVHHALRAQDKVPCAVKIIQMETMNDDDQKQVQEEVSMMLSMKHPNVLPCHAVFQCRREHVDELWVVMPFMDLGSALRVMTIRKQKGEGAGVGRESCKALLEKTLNGLRYLHDQDIVHRDVKAGNILLDSSGRVCIADFGVSSWLRDRRTGYKDRTGSASTFVGTPCWMAPEVMEQSGGYDSLADVWSFGITALELAKGCAPYFGEAPVKVSFLKNGIERIRLPELRYFEYACRSSD